MSCFYCDDTGRVKKTLNEEEFDRLFDKYCDSGVCNMGESRKRAMEEVGYKIVPCSECEKGKEYAESLKYCY